MASASTGGSPDLTPALPAKKVSIVNFTNKVTNANSTTTWDITFPNNDQPGTGTLAVVSVTFANSGNGAKANLTAATTVSNTNPPNITIDNTKIPASQSGTITVKLSNSNDSTWQGQGTIMWSQ